MYSDQAGITTTAAATAAGLAVGAGLMFFLDPRSGRRRRALLTDQLNRGGHESIEFARKARVDAQNRVRGLAHRSRAALHRERADGEIIAERVRAALGRLCSHPSAIEVFCTEESVHLRGDILADEVSRVLTGVRNVRGVKDVVNQLQIHDSAESVPSLQGRAEPLGAPLPEYLQDNWAPAPRVFAGIIGLGLIATGGRAASRLGSRGSALTTASLGIAGTALLLRAVSNRPFTRLLSREADAEEGFLIQKSLHIYAETDELYSAWRALENFPSFMSHIREVTKLDDRRYRWSADGPGGVPVSWESEITADVPNELIAWRTVPGSVIQSSGVVQFEPSSVGGTRIHLRMTYRPPADLVGHAAAVMFGADPRHQIDEDLLRFKSFMETGKTTGREGTVLRH